LPKRTRSAELAALTAIAAQVNCTQNLDEILKGALQTTVEVTGVDAAEIFITDQESGELILSVGHGLSDEFVSDEAILGPDECLCGLAARSRQAVIAVNVIDHPARTRPTCLRDGFQSLVCLPLRARGQDLGLLNVQSRAHRDFGPEDLELLTAIGNQIGIAIENARLIDDAEHRRATLDSVMRSLVDGLLLVDRRGQVTYANPCAEAMLGLAGDDLVGQPLSQIDGKLAGRAGRSGSLLAGLFPAAGAQGDGEGQVRAVEFELPAVPAPGGSGQADVRTLQARLFPVRDPDSGQLGRGLLLRDITHEKELDRLKSQLLSTVSHELRTPLASIKGFATTLLREDVAWDDGTRREFLAIIDQESDRLSELIGNLLDMARVEAGTLRVEPEPTNLRPIVEETVGTFRLMTSQHQFQIKISRRLPKIMADPRRVRQVLRNLVENAVKYSPAGGPIVVSVEAHSDALQIGVTDRGIGIQPEYLDRVFDRFYQVDSASTRKVGGSGLGLSICKAIVEAHKGRIWVESQVGMGSSFYFTLPLAQDTLLEEEGRRG
jgi:signal transduction histidine kinase/putative methionine-R-sulfoxide reductase with GAF domain